MEPGGHFSNGPQQHVRHRSHCPAFAHGEVVIADSVMGARRCQVISVNSSSSTADSQMPEAGGRTKQDSPAAAYQPSCKIRLESVSHAFKVFVESANLQRL